MARTSRSTPSDKAHPLAEPEPAEAFVAYNQIVGASVLPDDRDAPVAVYCRSGSMSAEASASTGPHRLHPGRHTRCC